MFNSPANTQSHSPLFTLALETRLQIYQEIIKSAWPARIHIVASKYKPTPENPQRFIHVPCKIPLEGPNDNGVSRYGHATTCNISREAERKWGAPRKENANISLFLVCRQITHESHPLLPTIPIFSLPSIPHSISFLTSPSLPSHHITNLHISIQPQRHYLPIPEHYMRDPHIIGEEILQYQQHLPGYPEWETLCKSLAQLPNLRELRIFLDDSKISEQDLFAPLQQINLPPTPKGSFIIRIPQPKKYSTMRDSYASIDTLPFSRVEELETVKREDGSEMPFRVDRRLWPDQDHGNWGGRYDYLYEGPGVENGDGDGGTRRGGVLCIPCSSPLRLLRNYWKKRRGAE